MHGKITWSEDLKKKKNRHNLETEHQMHGANSGRTVQQSWTLGLVNLRNTGSCEEEREGPLSADAALSADHGVRWEDLHRAPIYSNFYQQKCLFGQRSPMPRQRATFRPQCLGTSESSPCFPLLREQRKSLGDLRGKELKEMGQKTNAGPFDPA